jgi:IS5 family transposase
MAAGVPGFFDMDERLAELSSKGDDLERVNAVVDFELFRASLEAAVPRADRSKGGRPPFDAVLMFKVLILQTMHSLSDERTEYLIKDRLSFMRFLGLSLADGVPDANTIWTFREALKKANAVEGLFARFDEALRVSGFLAMRGQIIDATIVAAPKQRNTKAEKQAIKEGRIPEDWRNKPAKLAQKSLPSGLTRGTATPAGRSNTPRPSHSRTGRNRRSTSPSRRSVTRTTFPSTVNMD